MTKINFPLNDTSIRTSFAFQQVVYYAFLAKQGEAPGKGEVTEKSLNRLKRNFIIHDYEVTYGPELWPPNVKSGERIQVRIAVDNVPIFYILEFNFSKGMKDGVYLINEYGKKQVNVFEVTFDEQG